MRWRGETKEQWLRRTTAWHKKFLLLPRQMRSGTWVWLESVWARQTHAGMRQYIWEFGEGADKPSDSFWPPTSPAPKPHR